MIDLFRILVCVWCLKMLSVYKPCCLLCWWWYDEMIGKFDAGEGIGANEFQSYIFCSLTDVLQKTHHFFASSVVWNWSLSLHLSIHFVSWLQIGNSIWYLLVITGFDLFLSYGHEPLSILIKFRTTPWNFCPWKECQRSVNRRLNHPAWTDRIRSSLSLLAITRI